MYRGNAPSKRGRLQKLTRNSDIVHSTSLTNAFLREERNLDKKLQNLNTEKRLSLAQMDSEIKLYRKMNQIKIEKSEDNCDVSDVSEAGSDDDEHVGYSTPYDLNLKRKPSRRDPRAADSNANNLLNKHSSSFSRLTSFGSSRKMLSVVDMSKQFHQPLRKTHSEPAQIENFFSRRLQDIPRHFESKESDARPRSASGTQTQKAKEIENHSPRNRSMSIKHADFEHGFSHSENQASALLHNMSHQMGSHQASALSHQIGGHQASRLSHQIGGHHASGLPHQKVDHHASGLSHQTGGHQASALSHMGGHHASGLSHQMGGYKASGLSHQMGGQQDHGGLPHMGGHQASGLPHHMGGHHASGLSHQMGGHQASGLSHQMGGQQDRGLPHMGGLQDGELPHHMGGHQASGLSYLTNVSPGCGLHTGVGGNHSSIVHIRNLVHTEHQNSSIGGLNSHESDGLTLGNRGPEGGEVTRGINVPEVVGISRELYSHGSQFKTNKPPSFPFSKFKNIIPGSKGIEKSAASRPNFPTNENHTTFDHFKHNSVGQSALPKEQSNTAHRTCDWVSQITPPKHLGIPLHNPMLFHPRFHNNLGLAHGPEENTESSDPNSFHALRKCRYLRIPKPASHDHGIDHAYTYT